MSKQVQATPGERSVNNLLDPVHGEFDSFGHHYQQKLFDMLGNIARRKLLLSAVVAVVLMLGLVAMFAVPKRYTAEAYIRGGFAASNSVGTSHGGSTTREFPIAVDASLVVETQSRLFQSHQLARQVVNDLGLEALRSEVGRGAFSSWLETTLYGDAANSTDFRQDRAATRLLRGLSVTTEPRVYQILLNYTSTDPKRAALITNAFVVAFLRTTALQSLAERRAVAQAVLSENRATLGDKHPKVREAAMRLASTEALITDQLGKTRQAVVNAAGENVTFAQANVVPSGPNPATFVGVSLLFGLISGIGLVLWLEQNRMKERREAADEEAAPSLKGAWSALTP